MYIYKGVALFQQTYTGEDDLLVKAFMSPG